MSVSKKYISKKIVHELGDVGTAVAAAGAAAAVPAVLGLVFAFKDNIAGIVRRYKWDKQGCDAELDPGRKQQCKVRLNNKYIAAYSRARSKCNKAKDPQACVDAYNKKIAMLEGQSQQNY